MRVAAALATPFVLLADASGNVIVAFFGVAERLNPLVLLRRILDPLRPYAMRVLRSSARVFERPIAALNRLVDRFFGWVGSAFGRLRELLKPIGTKLLYFWRRLLAVTEAYRRNMSDLIATVRTFGNRMAAPTRRFQARVAAQTRRFMSALRRN